MFKIIKWDTIDFTRKYSWALLGFVSVILIAAIPQDGSKFLAAILISLCTVLGGFFFTVCLFLAAVQPINWLRKDSVLLELSLPTSCWKLLFSKLTLAGLLNLAGCLLLMQLMLVFGKYSTGSISLLSINSLSGILLLVIFLTMVDATVLFAYLISKSVSIFRRRSAIMTLLLSFILLVGIITSSVVVMLLTNSLVLPSVSTNQIFTLTGNLVATSTSGAMVVFLFTFVLELICSSILLKYQFQWD